jgi:hypothetical protein
MTSSNALGRAGRTAPGEVEDATLRYLMYGLLPAWTVPAAADWIMHRRTRIQDNAGTRESLIHFLMMAEVGVPAVLVLLCEVDPPLLAALVAGVLAHEATALWDVRTAQDSGREVTVTEQHVHSFLESLPYMALAALACLHPDQVRGLRRRLAQPARGSWRLTLRRPSFPARYLVGVAAGAGALGLLYGEELARCRRASRRRGALLHRQPITRRVRRARTSA